jgi:hypothetical protein
MAKFRMRLKIQGFELEVDGEREDIPAITSAIQSQFAGLIQPAEMMVDGQKQLADPAKTIEGDTSKNGARPAGKKRPGAAKSSTGGGPTQPIELRHDAATYGNPLQSWSVTDKSIWMLAVIKGSTNTAEVAGPQVAATFNQYFKQAGKVHPPNVTRELGTAKVQNPAPVGEDKGLWYLTAEGDRQAQVLIQSVLNPQTA